MKEKFKEFYKYSDNEIKTIWENCIFVFDTNVLLDLYRYSKKTSDEFLKILNKIYKEKRLWIPHQVGLEFHKRRMTLISDLKKSYCDIKEIIENAFSDAQKKVDDKYHKEHPFLDLKEIESEINKCKKNISKTIDKNEKAHPDWFNKDEILEELTKIFDKNIGEEYTKEKLAEIIKEGEDRYEKKIPPGYEDAKSKDDDKKYGDLILWFQIIEMAKKSKKSVIFITRDNKSDWWWKQSENTIGPRHELKREIKNKADVNFHMYNSERFLEYASEFYKEAVDKKSIKEVKRTSRLLEEKNYIMHKIMHSRKLKSPLINEFMMQQKMLSEELLHLIEEMDMDEDFLFEFNRNQERIMRFVDRFANEKSPHPMMFEELFMLQERMQRRFINLMESKEMNKEQKKLILRFFERMNESFIMLMQYTDKEGISEKYSDRVKINNHRLRRSLINL